MPDALHSVVHIVALNKVTEDIKIDGNPANINKTTDETPMKC